jgi:hypothetical protein
VHLQVEGALAEPPPSPAPQQCLRLLVPVAVRVAVRVVVVVAAALAVRLASLPLLELRLQTPILLARDLIPSGQQEGLHVATDARHGHALLGIAVSNHLEDSRLVGYHDELSVQLQSRPHKEAHGHEEDHVEDPVFHQQTLLHSVQPLELAQIWQRQQEVSKLVSKLVSKMPCEHLPNSCVHRRGSTRRPRRGSS